MYEDPRKIYTGQDLDLDALLSDGSKRCIELNGYFQRFEYYLRFRETISQWFAFDHPAKFVPKSDVVVNVRRTDYVQLGWALPFEYYAEAINLLLPKGGSVCIVTDDRKDPFFDRFAAWDVSFSVEARLSNSHL